MNANFFHFIHFVILLPVVVKERRIGEHIEETLQHSIAHYQSLLNETIFKVTYIVCLEVCDVCCNYVENGNKEPQNHKLLFLFFLIYLCFLLTFLICLFSEWTELFVLIIRCFVHTCNFPCTTLIHCYLLVL